MTVDVITPTGLSAISWSFLAVAVLLTFGRFYIRWRKGRKIQADDIFNGAAVATLIVYIATIQVTLQAGYLSELANLGVIDFVPTNDGTIFALKMALVNVNMFWATVYLVKGAFLALYWTVFKVSPAFRKAWWIITVFNLVSYFAIFMSTFWQCNNPRILFDPVVCNEISYQLLVNLQILWVTLNVLGDLLLMILPLRMLKTLHMGKAEKAGLATVFAIVALNIIIDVIRVATNLSPFSASNPNLNAVITMVEPSITVMVCALPSYRSLLSGPRRKSSAAWENSDEVQLNRYRRTNEGDDRSGHSSRSVPETIVEITSKA